MVSCSPIMKPTGYFTHAACLKHDMGSAHPECPERLSAIEDRLLAAGLSPFLEWREPLAAALDVLALAHSPSYIDSMAALNRVLAEQALRQPNGSAHYQQLDADTALNPHTWEAALFAAGAAIDATRAVVHGELANAFCAVRPPGHHACKNKAMGFCFFNNVAVAAKYALDVLGLERVAIIDFDVHHGNGTEDIVVDDDRILMCSFYQHPFYPEGPHPHAPNLVNVPVSAYTKGADIQSLVQTHWLPRLHAHRPQLVLISAGFDGHREDDLGQLGLVEQDYVWLTHQMKAVADAHAHGRMVSVLEGGYNLSALGRSVEAHVRVLADL